MTDTTYAFSNTAPEAGTQLDCLQHMLDPHTTKCLAALPIRAGDRCWEIGAGAGSIANVMATATGPTGYVLATDINTGQLHTAEGIHVTHHDITSPQLPDDEPFDVIHARLVLLHLPQGSQILTRLVGALAPGGHLLLEEFDCARPLPVLTSATPADADLFTRVHTAILAILASQGASMTWAYEAYGAMVAAGLYDVTTVAHAETMPADSLGAVLHDVNSRQLQQRLLEQGISPADLDAFRALMHDPAFSTMGYPLVSTWGHRPR